MEGAAITDDVKDLVERTSAVTVSSSPNAQLSDQKAVSVQGAEKATEAVATAIVDIKGLTDQEVIALLQVKEFNKMKERYARIQAKGQDNDREHKFWNTQPVPRLKDVFGGDSGPLDQNTDIASVKQEPYNMPAGFEWCSLDVTDPATILEVYTLLFENYVEDDDCLFRFDYSIPFLQWALTPPGFHRDWHVGVRNSKNGETPQSMFSYWIQDFLYHNFN